MEEEIKKKTYQSIIDFSLEVKKEVSERIKKYGDQFIFSDIFFRDEFSELLFDYLDGKIDKEKFKEKINGKLLLGNLMIKK